MRKIFYSILVIHLMVTILGGMYYWDLSFTNFMLFTLELNPMALFLGICFIPVYEATRYFSRRGQS